ncbi:hypothetical protein FHR32_008372 [Streptosporangium album]|uniref:Uncharacterized protein n=1 Tax=Streptosporangium album TaxID=47479 RepID=A0A7W7S4Y8_9ACTN|nr:hypothetical protein [Streptosporangium album]MBB4943971.1 hypothetical protein [Streptosporangium album]
MSVTPSLISEISFPFRALACALTWPTKNEVVGGVISKGPGIFVSIAWWTSLLLPNHPVIFAIIITITVLHEGFHGIWVYSWQEFQAIIGSRSFIYQTVLNLVYMQVTLAIYRILTWLAIPSTILPWQAAYWRDVSIVVVAGSVSGTLGYRGLNALYDKGRIGRHTRSHIQQGRDLFLALASSIFASSSMHLFWILFALQQLFDYTIFVVGWLARPRPSR